jgi:hypothetical protein
MKARRPAGKYRSTSSGVFSLFVIGYIFCGIGTHTLLPILQSFECLYCRCYSDPNQIKNQLTCKLCTSDSIQVALGIYLLNPV